MNQQRLEDRAKRLCAMLGFKSQIQSHRSECEFVGRSFSIVCYESNRHDGTYGLFIEEDIDSGAQNIMIVLLSGDILQEMDCIRLEYTSRRGDQVNVSVYIRSN